VTSTDFDRERVVLLLSSDVACTFGEALLPYVHREAANVRELAEGLMKPGPRSNPYTPAEAQRFFDQKVVDDFQQTVHDERLSPAWPACPRHPNHPLEYSEESGAWHCPRDGDAIAPLGELSRLNESGEIAG
jgi:hypothetical protein